MMSNKNEVFEYLIDQLRQQVNSSPYKQQCEDLAHEVQSLKNQLRDASAQIKELQEDNIKKSEHISHLTGQSSAYRNDALRFQAQVEDLVKRLATATGDVEAYKLIREQEQSGCRKEDVQAEKSWVEHNGAAACPVPDDTVVDIKFRNGEVESNTKALWWSWGTSGGPYEIVAYRVVKPGCEHECRFYGAGFSCKCIKCGKTK